MEVFCFVLNIAEEVLLSSGYLAATANNETEVNIYNGESGEPQENNSNHSCLWFFKDHQSLKYIH